MNEAHTRAERIDPALKAAGWGVSYSELAPPLAERVLVVESGIKAGALEGRTLDEELLLDLYRGIWGDLVPAWGGPVAVNRSARGELSAATAA